MRIPRFHPLSDTPLFESLRTLRGHAFYPGASVLRTLVPCTPRPPATEAPCVVYHSPWGHLVVSEIDPETLNGYGWTCLSGNPFGAEWGDLGYMGNYQQRRGAPWELWERDLHSSDANAAAAVTRILLRYAPPADPAARDTPDEPAAPAPPAARVPRAPRGSMSHR
ncbi:hypothetical protein KUF83_30240 [Streptomyces sp. BV286]|uniref:hypothetical protein n=1 Tax=Streptomyces sp. BV286 TaxID=2849672 RepID=UPI001C2EBA78|nr:hypothetical protein [Streptomyces sp. BV286]MBV1940817.1 hypothetical protein [Streptomyces sp. BV286]